MQTPKMVYQLWYLWLTSNRKTKLLNPNRNFIQRRLYWVCTKVCIGFVPKSVLGLYQRLYWVCTKVCIGFVPKSALMLSLFYTELILIIGTNHCVFVSSSFVICMFNKCLINDIAFHTACLHSLSPPCIWEKHTLYTGNINQVKM